MLKMGLGVLLCLVSAGLCADGDETSCLLFYKIPIAPVGIDAKKIAPLTIRDAMRGVCLHVPSQGRYSFSANLSKMAGYNIWLSGQETIRLEYRIDPAFAQAELRFLLSEPFTLLSPSDALIADGQFHVLRWRYDGGREPSDWKNIDVTILSGQTAAADIELAEITVHRQTSANGLDADAVLASPPGYEAKTGMHNGAMAMFLDGRPISGMGWSSSRLDNGAYTKQMDEIVSNIVGKSGFDLARMMVPLGQTTYDFYPPSWIGPNEYDWRYMDKWLGKFVSVNPNVKVILQIDLTGVPWWVLSHPESAGMNAEHLTPDYLSPDWQKDARNALRQMIAHIQSGPYKEAVIGYQLMNGYTLDCNFEVNYGTPAGKQRFQAFLKRRYNNDVRKLQDAWRQPEVTFETALVDEDNLTRTPADANDPFAVFRRDTLQKRLTDSLDFLTETRDQIIANFCRWVKEATHGRALAGIRSGDFLVGPFGTTSGWVIGAINITTLPKGTVLTSHMTTGRLSGMLAIDELDYFEQWEPYPGRGLGDGGSGAPTMPIQALQPYNTLVVLENDVRTHDGYDKGYGYTKTPQETVIKQRQVFINAMTTGMYPYLWQMSYRFDTPELMREWPVMQMIFRNSLRLDRNSGAEVAYVTDVDFGRSMGYSEKVKATLGFDLFDYPRFNWARAGAPYDIVFLNQIETTKPYKVYVFFHTISITDQQREKIHRVMARNRSVAIFCWGDGLLYNGQVDPEAMSRLAGMTIKAMPVKRSWRMTADEAYARNMNLPANQPLGVLDPGEGLRTNYNSNTQTLYSPAFVVDDQKAEPLAFYTHLSEVGAAVKPHDGWTSIYSASPILHPSLIRYALRRTGGFEYTDTDDIVYINNSFIGLHTRRDTNRICVKTPEKTALYEVFEKIEYPAGQEFNLSVKPLHTYLYFRGTQQQWEQLCASQTDEL